MNRIARRSLFVAPLLLGWVAACGTQPGPETMPAPEAAPTAEAGELDRTVQPQPTPAPSVDLPEVQRRTLPNGLNVWIVEQPEVPLVSMRMVVDAGSAAEPADQPGLASLTAEMLDEGTATRSALEIADELDFLGADMFTDSGYESAVASLTTLERNLPAALEVFADVITHPSFPTEEMERVRNERLTSIIEGMDRPTMVASQQFAEVLYGPNHPYGRPTEGTPLSVRGFQASQLQDFYRTWYRPNNADLIVVGDVEAGAVMPLIEQAFAGWERAKVPTITFPAIPPAQSGTQIFLIDKPGAAQSEIRIGHVGVERDNPDYFPLLVMNTILGGQFSSRINLNLREDKGYTYGARSGFSMRRRAGPFTAQAGVQTPSTKESVIEFMNELEGIRGGRPITEEEIEFAKNAIIRGEPLELETPYQIASRLEDLIIYDLPPDYYDNFTREVQAVTLPDVERVAREYLDPEHFAIVIVGDRSQVEPGLRELPYPVEIVTLEQPTITGGQ